MFLLSVRSSVENKEANISNPSPERKMVCEENSAVCGEEIGCELRHIAGYRGLRRLRSCKEGNIISIRNLIILLYMAAISLGIHYQ